MTTSRKTDVQIRGVPLSIRDKLRRRAASKGTSMSQYVIDLLRDDLSRPTIAEWLESLEEFHRRQTFRITSSVAEVLWEARREEGLAD